MRKTWPGSIASIDIELRIGALQALFFTRNDDWIAALFLSFLPLFVGIPVFACWLFIAGWQPYWWVWLLAFSTTFLLWYLVWWYRHRRKYFAICHDGCAYGNSQAAVPVIILWNDMISIQLDEDATLRKEENAVFGITLSTSMHEITRRSLNIHGSSQSISFKLSEFPESKLLLDAIVDASTVKNIHLEHARHETPELTEAIQSGQASNFGIKQKTAVGIVLAVLFIAIKIIVAFKK